MLKNLCLSSRQTEGPTGPLYASSNPEYISASDGESSEGFLQYLILCMLIRAVQQYGIGVVFMEFSSSFKIYTHRILQQCYPSLLQKCLLKNTRSIQKRFSLLNSLRPRRMGGATRQDHSPARAGTGLLRHGVRRNRQGHSEGRAGDSRSCENR